MSHGTSFDIRAVHLTRARSPPRDASSVTPLFLNTAASSNAAHLLVVTRDEVLALLDMRLKERPSPVRRSVPQSLFFGEDESEEGN